MMQKLSPRRRFTRTRGLLIAATLLAALLVVAACGRGRSEAPPTATPIATLAAIEAPTATPEPAPTDTPEAAATEEPTAEPTAEVAGSEALTGTATLTDTTSLTQTDAMTGTGEITATESVTATDSVTESGAVTESAAITGTEMPTATEGVTATAEVTATESPTGTDEITATEEMTEAAAHEHGAAEPMTDTVASEAEAGEPRIHFIHPTENAILPIPATVAIGSEGIDFEADGSKLYLIVDGAFVADGAVVPENVLYQQVEDPAAVEVTIMTGTHTLRAQVVDADGVALEGDGYRAEIIVRALASAPAESVRIASPTEGATVPPTFEVVMAATGLAVEAAGMPSEDAGHLHLLVDTDFVEAGQTMPLDEAHLHFASGAITTELTLEPGEHTLRLQFADGAHTVLEGDEYRDEITVTVEEGAPAQQVMFTSPEDGATVSTTFTVTWAAAGLIIEQAGPVMRPEAGHLHLLIDEEFSPENQVVANDATHIHFGLGQTSTEVTLEPGEHTLRLQMANGAHFALGGEQYEDEITITVE